MIVVTGGAGFIGSCILASLNAKGRKDIIVADHLDDDLKKENLKNKKFSQYLGKKDFLKLVIEDRLDPKVDTLIHMGACSSTTLQDARYFEENNFAYSCHLARWALKHKARFIYASSAATYGDGSCGYRDDDETIRRCRPLNLYGESKQKFDLWVLGQGLAGKMVGLKFFNVFGPNEYHKQDMRSVIAKAYPGIVKDGKMVLFKSYKKEYAHGDQKRDFIYIKNAVDIVMFFFEHSEINGIYNVGTGKARTWNDLAIALFKAVGKKPGIEYIEMPDAIRSRYQYFTQADITKLRTAGYKRSFITLEESITDYVPYLKEHRYL